MPVDHQKSDDYKDDVDDLHPEPLREESRISPSAWLDRNDWKISYGKATEKSGSRTEITYSSVYRKVGTQYRCKITKISTHAADVDDVRSYDPGRNPYDHQTLVHRGLLERAQVRDTPGAIGQTLERGVRDRGR